MKKLMQQNPPGCHWFVMAAFIGALCACSAEERTPRYSVIPLGTPNTEFDAWWSENYMEPSSINNSGDVVGVTAHAPFLYREGTVRYLWTVDESYYTYYPPAINDRGTIAAIAFASAPELSPTVVTFTYSTAGQNRDFNFNRASTVFSGWLIPWDINEHGTIVGVLDTIGRTAAVYEHGQLRLLPSLAAGADAVALAINNRGQIIGTSGAKDFSYPMFPTRAVIWSDGQIRDLGLLPGCVNAYGTDINDRGEAIGTCDDVSPTSEYRLGFAPGFIYRNGAMTQIPVPAGIQVCAPQRINKSGDVLIQYRPRLHPEIFGGSGSSLYADGVLYDLTEIVSQATGWRIINLTLYDMNDRGETVGTVQYDHRDGNFVTQGILLIPQRSQD